MNPNPPLSPETADPFLALRTSLEGYFAAISQQKQPSPPPLIPHFQALDAWYAQWGNQTPPRLRHYLQNKSYTKALAFLRGEEIEGDH